MAYNLHPIFVHFPIALLFLYSIIKILPFESWFPKVTWKHTERVLLSFGVMGAFLALLTGENAIRMLHPDRALVEMHSFFGGLATFLYGMLLVGECLTLLNPIVFPKIFPTFLVKISIKIEHILSNRIFSKLLAFVALIAICLTGLLGGVMVYGTSADPAAGFVLKILGITP